MCHAKHQVVLLLARDGAFFHFDNLGRTVMGIHHPIADFEGHENQLYRPGVWLRIGGWTTVFDSNARGESPTRCLVAYRGLDDRAPLKSEGRSLLSGVWLRIGRKCPGRTRQIASARRSLPFGVWLRIGGLATVSRSDLKAKSPTCVWLRIGGLATVSRSDLKAKSPTCVWLRIGGLATVSRSDLKAKSPTCVWLRIRGLTTVSRSDPKAKSPTCVWLRIRSLTTERCLQLTCQQRFEMP